MGVSGPEMALELPSRLAGSNNSRLLKVLTRLCPYDFLSVFM